MKVWKTFKDSDGVVILLKTNYGKEIAAVIPTKIENTQRMEDEFNDKIYLNCKKMPGL